MQTLELNLFKELGVWPLASTAEQSNELYKVNIRPFSIDDQRIDELSTDELAQCRKDLKLFIQDTQPDVVLLLGTQVARTIYQDRSIPTCGQWKSVHWDNTGRKTLYYVIPNSAKVNRSISKLNLKR